MNPNELMIAAVMVGAALAYVLWRDGRDRRKAEDAARMRGERITSVAVSPSYADPYAVFRQAEQRGQAKYLEDGFSYIGAMEMASKLQRLPAPEQPRTAAPTVSPSPQPAPGQ